MAMVESEALKDSPLVMPAAGLKQPTPVFPIPMYASGTKPACNSSHLLRMHSQHFIVFVEVSQKSECTLW